jgi:hypothetical protein
MEHPRRLMTNVVLIDPGVRAKHEVWFDTSAEGSNRAASSVDASAQRHTFTCIGTEACFIDDADSVDIVRARTSFVQTTKISPSAVIQKKIGDSPGDYTAEHYTIFTEVVSDGIHKTECQFRCATADGSNSMDSEGGRLFFALFVQAFRNCSEIDLLELLPPPLQRDIKAIIG